MRLSGKEAPEMTRARKVQDPREQQKDAATKGLHNIESTIGLMADLNSEARDLLNHVQGFYLEVDKLAKGKAMLEVTQRILDETNLIISDAKRLAKNDPFLSRTKEFVTAGNNPVYPDVVVTIRTVQQSLDRLLERIARNRPRQTSKSRANSGQLSRRSNSKTKAKRPSRRKTCTGG
jgi:hypothetical protein